MYTYGFGVLGTDSSIQYYLEVPANSNLELKLSSTVWPVRIIHEQVMVVIQILRDQSLALPIRRSPTLGSPLTHCCTLDYTQLSIVWDQESTISK